MPGPARPPREPLWDNARWIAICLVVVGHAIEVPHRNDVAFGVYLVIYTVHIPLFAFISGRFSRAEPITVSTGSDLLRRLVAPLLIFQLLYIVLLMFTRGIDFSFNPLVPFWHLWFLAALLVWRLVLPLFGAVRFPVMLALVIAAAAGMSPTTGLVGWVSRTFAFLPFFVAGWAWQTSGLNDRLLDLVRRAWARVLAAVLILVSVVAATHRADAGRASYLRKVVQGEWTYARMGYDGGFSWLLRIGAFVAGLALIWAVLALTSRRHSVLSVWGTRTMTIYCVHLAPILVAQHRGWISPDRNGILTVLALALAAVLWTVVLSTRMVDGLARPLVQPRLRWLLLPARGR